MRAPSSRRSRAAKRPLKKPFRYRGLAGAGQTRGAMPYCHIIWANGIMTVARTRPTLPVLPKAPPPSRPPAPSASSRPRLGELSRHGYSEDEIFALVVPKRTLARRKAANEPLTVEETDKALRLERIAVQAERVFGDAGKAHRWLRKAKRELQGRDAARLSGERSRRARGRGDAVPHRARHFRLTDAAVADFEPRQPFGRRRALRVRPLAHARTPRRLSRRPSGFCIARGHGASRNRRRRPADALSASRRRRAGRSGGRPRSTKASCREDWRQRESHRYAGARR